ncbi:MAG: hypothetical protein JXR94_18985, partial [Candidatus Hydrogenedentes bacterium]|nr:hypothetical protein [Candidatus Hydrogenedentota bacterium]
MNSPHHKHHCGCCAMSRRCFLAATGAALTAPYAAGGSAPDPDGLGEYIELEDFRPRPTVRILGAVVRYKPPYWLGWPGT